jgi:anti-sigma factor RsiW
MSTVFEIENAIDHLPPNDRAQIAAWLARKEAQDWDMQMHADSANGKLDFLFREAADERKSDQLKDWPKK